ncbi:hypothetical protein NQ176_g7827 [Zarea fungicola]|uniref:Uncharacterized protein n=1 Tax=Zarea fungicola TaxID=93591 RepID=A0ACC1MWG0_9HYPO|nr:hypothetical protein NQ176_g7827 [Lecanicillium fungicola]
MKPSTIASSLLGLSATALALQVDLTSDSSIKSTASTIAFGLMKYYNGNVTGGIPGLLPGPYYWWEAGGMFGHLIDYWYYTGDSSYNDVTMQGMMHQITPNGDYLPVNQTNAMGNDDQGFWALTSMMAAEAVFPNPPSDTPQWLAGVQAVFNEYVVRWKEENGLCGGGLRWQVYSFLNGWDYKNSIANGCFFNIAARLARFTGNQTYADWANTIYDWEVSQGLITSDYTIYDGIEVNDATKTCQNVHQVQFTYNAGVWLQGAAAMYDFTKNDTWKAHVDGIFNYTQRTFFKNNIIYEPACELVPSCDQNMVSFKSYLIRFLAATAQLAPWTSDTITTILSNAASDAVKVCAQVWRQAHDALRLPFALRHHAKCLILYRCTSKRNVVSKVCDLDRRQRRLVCDVAEINRLAPKRPDWRCLRIAWVILAK